MQPSLTTFRVLTLKENIRIRSAHDAGQDATLLQLIADLLLAVGDGWAPLHPPSVGSPHATPSLPSPQWEYLLTPFMHPPPELNSDPIPPSADRLSQDENKGAYPTELLNSKNPPSFALHQLRLKVGIPIILLRNADPVQGLANGTRLFILHLSPRVIEAKILTGIHVGQLQAATRG